jgi:MYXO-CTERM domain-containing protein
VGGVASGRGKCEATSVLVPAGVTAAPLTLAAGAEGDLRVTIADGALASGSAMLQIKTNDPDRPTAMVELGIQVGGTDDGEPPVIGEGQDGGCSTGSGQGAGMLVLALGFILIRRRR